MIKNYIFILNPKNKWNEAILKVKEVEEAKGIFVKYKTIGLHYFQDTKTLKEAVTQAKEIISAYEEKGHVSQFIIEETAGGGCLLWLEELAKSKLVVS